MAMDYATGYAEIVKYDKHQDGTLMVYGKATDDTLDLDSQICDPKWLDTAMPQWFKSGGNIREMHGPSAAGIAKEYEAKGDGHYIGVHVVDPLAALKVETGVYQGFSIGIKSPRVVRDAKAANGRIIDGQIVEVSLVDRPANPSAKLILAKAVEGETSLVQVEELHEFKAPLPSEVAKMTTKGSKMETIEQITELAKSLTADQVQELVKSLTESLKAADMPDCADGKCGKCAECKAATKESAEEESVEGPAGSGAEHELSEEKKSADVEETVAAIKEATEVVEEAIAAAEEVSEAVEAAESTSIEDVVEKAVKSAIESIKSEIDALRAEKESAVEKSVKLETELATALSKTVAGGPKRTATKLSDEAQNDMLVKATTYKAKADATTDPVLAKGYRDLANDFFAKAAPKTEN